MTALQAQVRQKREEKRLALAESNKKDGAAFLAANATKEGVVTLPAACNTKSWSRERVPSLPLTIPWFATTRDVLDNTEFDSSYKRGQPVTFNVGGVIKGWTEALQLMPVGSKWQLFIPPDLAYGDAARAPPDPTQRSSSRWSCFPFSRKAHPPP